MKEAEAPIDFPYTWKAGDVCKKKRRDPNKQDKSANDWSISRAHFVDKLWSFS